MSRSLPVMIQARMGSRRLPRKVMARIGDYAILDWVIRRSCASCRAGDVIVLTSDLPADDAVVELAESLGMPAYRGNEQDVALRYASAAKAFECDAFVRVTADCPFLDPNAIDMVIEAFQGRERDRVSLLGYPEGLGSVEVINTSALETILSRTAPEDSYYREHVSTYLDDNPSGFDIVTVSATFADTRPDLRFSVDTYDDLVRARRIASAFHPSRDFSTLDILTWVNANEITVMPGAGA